MEVEWNQIMQCAIDNESYSFENAWNFLVGLEVGNNSEI